MRRPSHRRARAIALMLAALALPARGDDAYNPYRIPPTQFRQQVARVALRPLRLPEGTANAQQVRGEFERRITAELEKRGYGVVPSNIYAETWLRFARDLGGVFDPVTGRPDEKKYALAWQHTARELETRHDVDAVLSPEIAVDAMPAAIGFWSWVAAGQPLYWGGAALASAPRNQPQRVEGPYLGVSIHDPAQVVLYEVRMPLAWLRVYLDGDYEERPNRQLYADAEHNQQTVERLLESLLDRNAPDAGEGS